MSVMVCTQLHFLESGIKVNGDYYRNVVLKEMLLPDIRHVAGDCFVFQPDNAPAHRGTAAKGDAGRLTIPPDLWPPNSPDLNPVDYCVWSILQEKVYRTRFANINELKCKLLRESVMFCLCHVFSFCVGHGRCLKRGANVTEPFHSSQVSSPHLLHYYTRTHTVICHLQNPC